MKNNRAVIIDNAIMAAINDGYIYPHIINICALMARKKARNKFDKEKAPRAFLPCVEMALREIAKDCPEFYGNVWHKILTPAERLKAAAEILEYYDDVIQEILEEGGKYKNKYAYKIEKNRLVIRECRNMYFLPGGKETTAKEYIENKEKKHESTNNNKIY